MSTLGPSPQRREFKPLVDFTLDRFDVDGRQTVFAVQPFGASETREERLARWQAAGLYDPACPGCAAVPAHPTLSPFQPAHRSGARCQSGGRPHCTCDACF